MSFVTPGFASDIHQNVVTRIFPLLQTPQKELLTRYLVNLVDILSYTLDFDRRHTEVYEHQLRQNQYRDLVALLLLLLPFINDDDNTKKQTVTSLEDVFIVKKNSGVDINKDEPRYLYSNLQFNRCLRNGDHATERKFEQKYLDHNYFLLLETVKLVSNKLYVNWMDLLPYDLRTYKRSRPYLETVRKIESGTLADWDPTTETFLKEGTPTRLTGLGAHDVYDTLSNEMYHNIVPIKWLIFDVTITRPVRNRPIPLITVISYVFTLDPLIADDPWDETTDKIRSRFDTQWRRFLKMVLEEGSLLTEEIGLDNAALQKMARSLLYAFDSKYKGKRDAIKAGHYTPFKQGDPTDEELPDDEEATGVLTPAEITSLKTLRQGHMYEFIRQSLQQFKYTWYYRYLFTDAHAVKTVDQLLRQEATSATLEVGSRTIWLSLKNVYNYAKSLTHSVRAGRFQAFPRFWRSLDRTQRTLVLDRLNNRVPAVMDWFNIGRYVLRTYPGADVRTVNEAIHTLIRKNLADYLFESLITRGALTKFRPRREVTDEKIIPDVGDERSKKIPRLLARSTLDKRNPYWEHGYYYLTGTPYAGIPRFRPTDRQGEREVDYFEFNTKDDWYTAYAMNWVSQIGFFHRYLNNRVIYVTGATGVGKSTQIPKLLLYALKAIDYNNSGTMVCTQPRIDPVRANARTVSTQLGVPVTDRRFYHVQYQHRETSAGGSYTQSDVDHLMLRFVTDGLLLQQLRNNYLAKKKIRGTGAYTMENIFDIVMVDEAHEHNKNMDLLLTLLRYGVHYNNGIKLVIVSATMDDDEPIYRRYYRDVNDNRLFPWSRRLEEHRLDRINVDRRFHISAPGQTTKYKIHEYYEPGADPVEVVTRIIASSPSGFVLSFQPGQREIEEQIEVLNRVLPPNVIALPFHSKLTKYQRMMVAEIDQRFQTLRVDRSLVPRDFNETTNAEGTSRYDRVVIVATNIAEASLTIANLKFVVDTGTQKTPIFDFARRSSPIHLLPISDSSRLQRRGRVGRRGEGTVYYLYARGTTEGHKTAYSISTDDISIDLYDLLADSDATPVFTRETDPNLPGCRCATLNPQELSREYDRQVKGVARMIERQYFDAEGRYHSYFGNPDHYDYENARPLPPVYPTGFSLETLTDATGVFYIIHPEEIHLRRNILGKIVGIKEGTQDIVYHEQGKRIVSGKMMSFWNALLENMYISVRAGTRTETRAGTDAVTGTKMEKTRLGKEISALNQELAPIAGNEFDVRLASSLFYGLSLGERTGESLIRLISLYVVTAMDPLTNMVTGKYVPNRFGGVSYHVDLPQVKGLVGGQRSDSSALLVLLDDLHATLQRTGISLSQDSPSVIQELATLKRLAFERDAEDDEERRDIYNDVRQIIRGEREKGRLTTAEEFLQEDYQLLRKRGVTVRMVMTFVGANRTVINEWCRRRWLKTDVIMRYVERYLSLQNIIFSNGSDVSTVVSLLKSTFVGGAGPELLGEDDRVTLSFLYGFKYHLSKKLAGDHYISVYEPSLGNVRSLKRTGPYIQTLVDPVYLQNYVLYLAEGTDGRIRLLHWLDPRLIRFLSAVYTNDLVYDKYARYSTREVKVETLGPTVTSNAELINVYGKSLEEILADLVGVHDPDIWFRLYEIFHDPLYLQTRRYHDVNYRTVRRFSLEDLLSPRN